MSVACGCGARIRLRVHEVVDLNVPRMRARLEAGLLHNAPCRRCGRRVQVEKWFLCRDRRQGLLIHVFPSDYRLLHARVRAQVQALHRLCELGESARTEVVFGYVELMAVLRGETLPPPPPTEPFDPATPRQVH